MHLIRPTELITINDTVKWRKWYLPWLLPRKELVQLKATKIFRNFQGRYSFLLDSSIWPELIKGQQENLCKENPSF